MSEVSERLRGLTDTQILTAFRDALVALYPILQRLDCISEDTQPYDSFDEIAESLWKVLVLDSLKWKHGLEASPQLPRYGFTDVSAGPDGYIEVSGGALGSPLRFVQFVGNRAFGPEPFNSAEGITATFDPVSIALLPGVEFAWVRG